MGKDNFFEIYRDANKQLGARPTIKVSLLSDSYNASRNFAGIMVYSHDGEYNWYNSEGCNAGHSGRAFYVLIKDTDGWNGVHCNLYQELFGPHSRHTTCCAGFSIMNSVLKYNSYCFNHTTGSMGSCRWSSDGQPSLSEDEKVLTQQAVRVWQEVGPGVVSQLSDSVHIALWAAHRTGAGGA
eukprot:365707-Chlamydomonas_euryale.AAC.19